MANDPWTGARLGEMTDAPAGGSFLAELVNEVGKWTLPAFTTTAARDAAFSAWLANGNSASNDMACTVNGTFYLRSGNGWIEMGSHSGWTPFQPTWTTGVGNQSIANGSLTGFYRRRGDSCSFKIYLRAGSSTNAGWGYWTIGGLPFTSAANEHNVMAKAFTTGGQQRDFVGFGYIPASSTQVLPHFINGATPPFWEQMRNVDNSGSAAFGVPWVGNIGGGGFQDGSLLYIGGEYEVAV